MSDLLTPIILMMLFVLVEAGVLQVSGRQKIDWLDVIFNINSGHMMLWLFRCLEVLCYSWWSITLALGCLIMRP